MIEKVRQADMVIWLDKVQYSRGGFTNRNRMPDGSWLTVPVVRETTQGPISQVLINHKTPWRRRHQKTLRQHYGQAAEPICELLDSYRQPLASLNLACLKVLLADCKTKAKRQIRCKPFDTVPLDAVSNAASVMLASLVQSVGGTVYLSGPSGRKYLDERPFRRRLIEVRYFDWDQPENPCAMQLLADRVIRV